MRKIVLTFLICLFFIAFLVENVYATGYLFTGSQGLRPAADSDCINDPSDPQPKPADICSNSDSQNSTTCSGEVPCVRGGELWSKYNLQGCFWDDNFTPSKPFWVYNFDDKVCSTADKCGDESGGNTGPYLNAGFCNCSVGGIYKVCCANGALANSCVQLTQDTTNPPYEGVCPSGSTTVLCGRAGEPPCNASACGAPSPTPCSGTPLSCQSSQVRCPTGYTPTQLSNGNYACLNSSGQVDCSTTPYCPSACPTTGGYTGETCTCGSGNVPTTCASDPNKCNTCSLKYCLNYAPNLCCYYNEPTCFKNDVANCKNFGPCGSDKCIPGSTRTVCSAPNVCPAP